MSEQAGNKCTAIPAAFIRPILEARKNGSYRGLGYFDFYWEAAENPATQAFLKFSGEPRGVIIIQVPSRPGTQPVLKPRDVCWRSMALTSTLKAITTTRISDICCWKIWLLDADGRATM